MQEPTSSPLIATSEQMPSERHATVPPLRASEYRRYTVYMVKGSTARAVPVSFDRPTHAR